MGLEEVPFDREKKITIYRNWGCDFNENPYEVMEGVKRHDEISDKLNELLVGLDISSFQGSRVKDKEGNFYYNASGWQLIDLVQEQRKNDSVLQDEKYANRLKWGCGPYNIFIPESICKITNS